MKHLTKDVAKAVLVWLVIEELQRMLGGVMIQRWLIELWHTFPFEIVTLSITIFVLVCYEYYKIFRLGVKEYERLEAEKQRAFDEFKTKTEKQLADLNTKYIELLQSPNRRGPW